MFQSLVGDDDFKLPSLKKKTKILNFPNDCLGLVLHFSGECSTFNSFLLLSKSVNEYLNSDSFSCHSKTVFKLDLRRIIPKTSKPYVTSLSVFRKVVVSNKSEKGEGSNMNNVITNNFPNLRCLKVINVDSLDDGIFKRLNKLEKIHLHSSPNFGNDGFQHLSETLNTLILDRNHQSFLENDHKITSDVLMLLPNLTHLEIHEFVQTFTSLNVFRKLKKIQKFRISGLDFNLYNNTNLYDEISTDDEEGNIISSWKDLEVLSLREVSGIKDEIYDGFQSTTQDEEVYFQRRMKLRKVSIHRCEGFDEWEFRDKVFDQRKYPLTNLEFVDFELIKMGKKPAPKGMDIIKGIFEAFF